MLRDHSGDSYLMLSLQMVPFHSTLDINMVNVFQVTAQLDRINFSLSYNFVLFKVLFNTQGSCFATVVSCFAV